MNSSRQEAQQVFCNNSS